MNFSNLFWIFLKETADNAEFWRFCGMFKMRGSESMRSASNILIYHRRYPATLRTWVVHMANSHRSQPLRHARIKQREVTVLRNLPIPCSNPRLWIQVAIFLFFAPPPPRCARRATSWHRASVPHPSPPLRHARIKQRGHHLDFGTQSPEMQRSWYDLFLFGLGGTTPQYL